jgi:hypothetical protein
MADEIKSESELKKEDWMNSKWRPMMGWMYMVVCMCDFILFPVLWSVLHATLHTANMAQWNPLTLQGAGLFHIAMGAVLGIAAFGRTQEKLGGANNGGMQPVAQSVTTTFGSPQSGFGSSPGGFSSSAPSGFNQSSPSSFGGGGFGSAPSAPSTSFAPAPTWGSTPTGLATTASGKKIVPQDDQPAL